MRSLLYGGYFKTSITKYIAKFSLPSVPSTFLRNVAHKAAGEVRGTTSQKTETCIVNSKKTSDPACNKFQLVLKSDHSPLRKSDNVILCTVIDVTEISIIFRYLQLK